MLNIAVAAAIPFFIDGTQAVFIDLGEVFAA